MTREQLERVRELMDQGAEECVVTGYANLIEGLTLPDPGDRHVLAAAIRCHADVIVTWNTRHFPSSALAPYGIEAQDPDTFLVHQIELDPGEFLGAARRQRANLKNPPKSADEFVDTLEAQGLTQIATHLRHYRGAL